MRQNHRILLLDMDGTLLDLHFDNYFWITYLPQAYATSQKVSLEEAKLILKPQLEGLRGTLNWYCTDYWSQLTGLNILQLKTQIKNKIQFLPNVPNSLKALRRQYSKLVIVTNAHPDSVALKHQQTRVGDYVDELISSHEFGAPKEEQAFWAQLQEHLGFENSDVCFVDDSSAVLASAKKFGIESLFQITQPDSRNTQQKIDQNQEYKESIKIININKLVRKQ